MPATTEEEEAAHLPPPAAGGDDESPPSPRTLSLYPPPPSLAAPSVAEEKISMLKHTLHGNLIAFILSVPSLVLTYLVYDYISVYIPAMGGMWGDHHAVLCVVCISSIELICATIHKFEQEYMKKHLLLQWPSHWLFYMGINWLCFQNRPGSWSFLVMTLSWSLSMCATYPLEKRPRDFFPKYVFRAFAMSLAMHGAVGVAIFLPITLTKLLSRSSPVVTSVVTGLVFPFVTWLARQSMTRFVGSYAKKSSKGSDARFYEMYNSYIKMISVGLVITPCVLNYLNQSVPLALLSAALQLAGELAGKMWIARATRARFTPEAEALANAASRLLLLRPGVGRVGGGGAKVGVEPPDGKREEVEEVGEGEEEGEGGGLKKALKMLATRWNAELTAEKAGILVASFIAVTTFNENANLSADELFAISGIFYGMEFITDIVFVFAMDKYFGIPLLAADINDGGEASIFTTKLLRDSVVMAFAFIGVASCIKMASMVPIT